MPEAIIPHKSQSRIEPDRMAWGVMLLFFTIFCFVCLSSTLGIYLFLFESTVPINVSLRVGRGTVTLRESDLIPRAIGDVRDLTNINSNIQTDSLTQTTVSFRDPQDGNKLIAEATLRKDTAVSLNSAITPHFDWSNGRHEIMMNRFSGRMDLLVVGAGERQILIQITTSENVLIHLDQNGRYLIEATPSQVRVVNQEGSAVLFASETNLEHNYAIGPGQQATYLTATDEILRFSAETNLIDNGLFVLSDQTEQGMLPVRWGCWDKPDLPPNGAFIREVFDGRSAIRLVRGTGASSHGETHCRQPFPEARQNVSQYKSLRLLVSFYINYQSLSECGTQGTECPLMLYIEYVDQFGQTRQWYQGFYYAEFPGSNNPLRIVGISDDHQKINEKAWYTFETDNLFEALPSPPTQIKTIEFYASGHQYDIFISEVALLAHDGSQGEPVTFGETDTTP